MEVLSRRGIWILREMRGDDGEEEAEAFFKPEDIKKKKELKIRHEGRERLSEQVLEKLKDAVDLFSDVWKTQ